MDFLYIYIYIYIYILRLKPNTYNMKKFTQHLKTTLLLSVFVLLATIAKAQNDYFIKNDGTKVIVYGEQTSFGDGNVGYIDENGKQQWENEKNVKLLLVGNSVVISLPSKKNSKNKSLSFIVAFNDKYILTGIPYSGYTVLDVFDRDFNNILDKPVHFTIQKQHPQKYEDAKRTMLNENIFKYFKECPKLQEAMLNNLVEYKLAYAGINYYNCDNAPDLFTNKKAEKSQEVAVAKEEKIAVEKEYYLITTANEKKTIVGLLRTPEDYIHYYEKTGATAYSGLNILHAGKVKYVFFDDEVFMPFRNTNDKLYLMKIMAYDSKYILAKDNKKGTLYVFDRNNKLIVGGIKKEGVSGLLEEYFKACPELVEQINQNIKFFRNFDNGVSYYNCGNSPKLIEDLAY